MTTAPRNQKTPYIVIGAIAIGAIVFGLFALTLQKDIGTFIVFVIVLIALCFIGVSLYGLFIKAWLQFAAMRVKQMDAQNQHERLMYELRAKYERPQLTPPQQTHSIDEKYTDPARAVALRLLSATIESKKYGANGTQIMTQADAALLTPTMIANDWSAAVAYLCSNYDVLTIAGKGTSTTNNKTVGRVLADTAVMSLPGVTR